MDTLSHALLIPRLNFTPSVLIPLPPATPERHSRVANGRFQSVHGRLQWVGNSSSLLILPPHASPLLQCGSSPWTIVLQDTPSSGVGSPCYTVPSGNNPSAPERGPTRATVWISSPPRFPPQAAARSMTGYYCCFRKSEYFFPMESIEFGTIKMFTA